MTIHLPHHRWIWDRLGLAPTADRREIRRAYAARLKAIDTDSDPEAFIALREAWEAAQKLSADGGSRSTGTAFSPEADEGDEPPVASITVDFSVGPVRDGEVGKAEMIVTHDAPLEAPMLALEPFSGTVGVPPPPEEPPIPAGEIRPELIVRAASQSAPAVPDEAGFPDPALFARIDARLATSGDDVEAREVELRAATEALLAHPSLHGIAAAAAVEDWLAGQIARFHPRSDPVLEVAAAHFGWAEKAEDWRAPPFLHWAARRLPDIAFERELVARRPRFRAVLAALRDEVPPIPEVARRIAPDIPDFAEYVALKHPTTIDACNREVLDWWNSYLGNRPRWQREWDALRRLWRNRRSIRTIEPAPRRSPGGWLVLGLFVAPYLFAWALLQRGYSATVRLIGFTWFAVVAAFLLTSEPPPPPAPGEVPIIASPVRYASAIEDLEPLLDDAFGSQNSYFAINVANRPLFDRLLERWEEARAAQEDPSLFREDIKFMLDRAYRDGVALGDEGLQRDHWRLQADRLRGLLASGHPASCDIWLRAAVDRTALPPDLLQRHQELAERAVMQSPATTRFGSPDPDVAMPPQLVAAGAARAALEREAFTAAVRGSGTAEARCAARIGLLDAALALPRAESETFLRYLSERHLRVMSPSPLL